MKITALAALSLATLALMTCPTHATDIEVESTDGAGQVGGFYGPYDAMVDDAPLAFGPTLAPDNDPSFQNYFMGRSTLGPLETSITTPERRVFFMFDMAGVLASIPSGETIDSVTIDLTLTAGGSAVLANFTGGAEVVEFSSTPYTPAEILDPDGTGTDPELIWSSFGTSTPYGSFGIDGTDSGDGISNGTLAMPVGTYTIDLPGAIPDLEAAILGGEMFIVTAKLESFDPGVIGDTAPPAVDPYEYVFGITDVVAGPSSTVDAPILTITTVPEPTSLALLSVGFTLLGRRRRD